MTAQGTALGNSCIALGREMKTRQSMVLQQLGALFTSGSMSGIPDHQLLERFILRRDDVAEAAFAALVDRHGPMVLKVCRSVLVDPHDAQDAFQATFILLAAKHLESATVNCWATGSTALPCAPQ